jgi:hypothetical protein
MTLINSRRGSDGVNARGDLLDWNDKGLRVDLIVEHDLGEHDERCRSDICRGQLCFVLVPAGSLILSGPLRGLLGRLLQEISPRP